MTFIFKTFKLTLVTAMVANSLQANPTGFTTESEIPAIVQSVKPVVPLQPQITLVPSAVPPLALQLIGFATITNFFFCMSSLYTIHSKSGLRSCYDAGKLDMISLLLSTAMSFTSFAISSKYIEKINKSNNDISEKETISSQATFITSAVSPLDLGLLSASSFLSGIFFFKVLLSHPQFRTNTNLLLFSGLGIASTLTAAFYAYKEHNARRQHAQKIKEAQQAILANVPSINDQSTSLLQ